MAPLLVATDRFPGCLDVVGKAGLCLAGFIWWASWRTTCSGPMRLQADPLSNVWNHYQLLPVSCGSCRQVR